jgi:hypothetical protein
MTTILLRAYLRPSGTLSFVEFRDGTVGIVQDDQPVAGCRWGVDQLEQGMTIYHQLRAQAANAANAPAPEESAPVAEDFAHH